MRLNENKSNIQSKTTVFATYCIIDYLANDDCLSSGFAFYLELTPRLPAKTVDMHFNAKAKTKKRKMKEEDEEKEKEVATIQGRNG